MNPEDFGKPNNPEQEKSNKLETLQNLKAHIESVRGQESEKGADMTFLVNLIDTLEELGFLGLAEKVRNEIIPRNILISVQNAVEVLDSGNIYDSYNIFGHEVRKGAAYLLRSNTSFQNICLQALKLCISFALLLKDYSWAEAICKFEFKDNERAAQIHKLEEESSDDELDIFNNIKTHREEITKGVKKAYLEFIDSTKDLPENNLDLRESYNEISRVIEEKIAELS